MEPSGRAHDIYFTRDFPVLVVIARWEAAGRAAQHLRSETIAEQLGRPIDEVIQSLGRLYHAGYVDAADASTFGGEDYMVRRLTAAGLQESGLWPKTADLAVALREVLEHEAQVAEHADPERGRRIRAVLDAMADLGTTFAAKLAAELLKTLSGAR